VDTTRVRTTGRPSLIAAARRGLDRRRRHRSQRGAALVEAALVLPIMVLILVGILEFGLLFTSYSTTTAASRSASRIAATRYATESDKLQEAARVAEAAVADLTVLNNATPVGMVMYKVADAATGRPAGGFPGNNMAGGCSSNCIRFSWNNSTKKMTRTSGSWTSPDACGVVVDSVGVWVQTRHDFITGMVGSQRYVNGHTVMRLEPLPTDGCSGENPA
jgi:Flp pilus assembly protein TadG